MDDSTGQQYVSASSGVQRQGSRATRGLPSRIPVVGLALAFVLLPSTASPQLETFVQAVGQLALAERQPQASRATAIRAAADRMADALTGWDRSIATHEAADPRGSSPDSYRLHVERGVLYRQRGRLDDAVRELDAALAMRPTSSDVQLLRALTLEAMHRSEDAARAFAAAWKQDDRSALKAYYLLSRPAAGTEAAREQARALLTETYRRGGFARTRPTLPPFVVLDAIPDNLSQTPVVGDSTTAEAFELVTQARFAEAIAALRRPPAASSRSDAESPRQHFLRAQQDERAGEIASARLHYQQALAGTLLGRSAMHVAIARLAQVEGDGAAAVDALTSAVRISSNDPYLHKELAAAHASEGRIDEAFCELVAVLLLDPGDAHAHGIIGQLFLDAERHRDAVLAFTRALELKPDAFEARYGLATALARLGDAAESARQLEQFERARRQAQEQRRRDVASDVEPQEAPRTRPNQDGGR